MTNNYDYITDIKDWSIVTNEKASLGYDLSQEKFKATIKLKDILDDKAFKLITILVPILTVAITLLITLIQKEVVVISFITPLCIFILFLFISLALVINVFKPKGIFVEGREPKNYWKTTLLNQSDQLVKFTLSSYIQDYINHNDKINKRSVEKLKAAIDVLYVALVLSFIVYLLLKCCAF
ncbi:MAG: hypothetical protein AB1706_10245 [Pseudomonadota bacterium]